MFSAALSFLGGSAFRLLFASITDFFEKRQEHQQEMDRLLFEATADKAKHERDLERLRLQADLGVKEILVQSDAVIGKIEAEAFAAAMVTANAPTGILAVDLWNGVIRPLAATIAIVLWVLALNQQDWKMSDWDAELVGTILGFFFASRALTKRKEGKA